MEATTAPAPRKIAGVSVDMLPRMAAHQLAVAYGRVDAAKKGYRSEGAKAKARALQADIQGHANQRGVFIRCDDLGVWVDCYSLAEAEQVSMQAMQARLCRLGWA
jgi:hypothetical protein